jgi:hypothetical protein
MPVRTPTDAEQVVVAPMSERLVAEIIESYAAGMSASDIAAERDLGLRRVQRKLKENASRVRELQAEHRKRESARIRKASQREREQEAALNPAATVTSATRISRKGMLDLYVSAKRGCWMREASVGWDRPATPGDFTRRGAKIPDDLYVDPGFGPPYPELSRHALGFVPPDQRVVARMSRVTESGATVTSPVQARDLEARIAEGWQRV